MKIDIDRHILSEITGLRRRKLVIRNKIDRLYNQYKELDAQESGLITHLVTEVELKEE